MMSFVRTARCWRFMFAAAGRKFTNGRSGDGNGFASKRLSAARQKAARFGAAFRVRHYARGIVRERRAYFCILVFGFGDVFCMLPADPVPVVSRCGMRFLDCCTCCCFGC